VFGRVTIYVLHVIETLADATYEEFRDIYAKLENEAAKKMDASSRPYRDKAVDLRTSIVVGNRVKGILDFIGEHDIDLIIMSSHKIGCRSGSGLGHDKLQNRHPLSKPGDACQIASFPVIARSRTNSRAGIDG